MDVEVEVADPGRWEEFRDLRLASLRDAPDAFWATYDEERERPDAFWRDRLERGGTLIATLDGRPCGLAMVGPSFGDTSIAGLYGVWVAPSARGRGAGDALIEAAVDHARARGFPRIVLDVGDDNDPAIALYRRHGFTATGNTTHAPPPREHLTEHELALDLPR